MTRNKHGKPHGKREEGAAMLVVMLVLLMSTATAIFAVHATQYEIRGAGSGRQGLQTQYVGETGAMAAVQYVDDNGGAVGLLNLMSRTVLPAIFMTPFFEPELAPNKWDYRLYLTDFTTRAPSNWPIETDPTRGPSLGRSYIAPSFIVDYNDNYNSPAAIAGARADGRGLSYVNVTASSHGRTDVNADYRNATYDSRLYHEGACDARAYLVVGPAFLGNGN